MSAPTSASDAEIMGTIVLHVNRCPESRPTEYECPCGESIALACGACDSILFVVVKGDTYCEHAKAAHAKAREHGDRAATVDIEQYKRPTYRDRRTR